ncbi:F-box protein [Legionella clemsonensis]|uniref:F-box domain-containing protein n=1 Tax=Legionella clemsonensis TaxID=1867846 RepID=A0A222P3T9_9GAMM|nr:hypothetical protein [Legionella clemsonensis]ASQ46516.1 hypothetical protein clem_09835 [Legionella clemsonensis]
MPNFFAKCPDDVVLEIISKISRRTQAKLAQVDKRFNLLMKNEKLELANYKIKNQKKLPYVKTTREKDILDDYALLSSKSEFTYDEVQEYIANFIKNSHSAKELQYQDVLSVQSRISLIPNLEGVIKKPIMLMVTMHVLSYLELFYEDQPKNQFVSEIIQKDLFHFITCLMINDRADVIRLENNGLLAVGRFSVSELILKYSVAVAQFMNKFKLTEIKEEEILKTQDEKLKPYKKFFCREYDSSIFKNEEDYKMITLGRKGCIFLDEQGKLGQSRYRFIDPTFLDYFAALTPQAISGRRNDIVLFVKNNPNDLLQPYMSSRPSAPELAP